jgi:hypothetical protein
MDLPKNVFNNIIVNYASQDTVKNVIVKWTKMVLLEMVFNNIYAKDAYNIDKNDLIFI